MSLNQFSTPNTYTPSVSFRDLTSTSSLKLADGTASTPSLCFASDTNTGLYRSAADSIGITCGGNQLIEIDPAATSIKLPVQFVDSLSSIATEHRFVDDVGRAGALFSGANGGYISFGQPLNENFDLRIRTDIASVNSVATKQDLTFCNESYSENYFQIDRVNRGVKLPANTQTPASYVPSLLNVYEEYSFQYLITGLSGNTTNLVRAVRIGKVITVNWSTTIAGNGTGAQIVMSDLPARFRPNSTQTFAIPVLNNNTGSDGNVQIDSVSGNLTFSSNSNFAVFTNGQPAQIFAGCVSYIVQ